MKYLAISKTPNYLAYALFNDKKLTDCGSIKLTETNENKRLLEWEQTVQAMIDYHKPTFILTHLLNKERTLKRDIKRIVEIRTILRLLSEKNKIIYAEFKTSGWEKRITDLKPTNRRKLKLMNDGYGLELTDVEIANAIILAEGVAWNRLQIGE